MPINIHGKEYKTVAERLDEIGKDLISVETEVLYQSPVVIKATITTTKGRFSGISAANPLKTIEKASPYEVAETSAVGRALSFAGYAGSEIASAEEMMKALSTQGEEKAVESHPARAGGITRVPVGEHVCSQHDEPVMMKEGTSKTTGKKYYYHRNEDGQICFGGGFK
jgi:hypothetical protein